MITTPADRGGSEPIALPADDYRRVIALARALCTADVDGFVALQPTEPGQAHSMMLAAVSVIAALASDDRLNGAETELARVLAATLKLEAGNTP
ncbi:hypothetical protein GCM10027405_31450 [Arthrobacter alkaliphilus]|uniref:hypothetical protein n=1 Tax=Arthrobacter alkaliphilus TaxID=369936 RepID=UPI001F173F70|nr:hypothetical protein [Arthrobacter alkaliphilus]